MPDLNIKVYHNTENNSTVHNQHFDGIVDACEQLYDAHNISYHVEQGPDDFNIDHKGRAVYGTDEESPMATGYGDESWSFCTGNGSPNGYSSAVSTCAKSEVDDYVSTYL